MSGLNGSAEAQSTTAVNAPYGLPCYVKQPTDFAVIIVGLQHSGVCAVGRRYGIHAPSSRLDSARSGVTLAYYICLLFEESNHRWYHDTLCVCARATPTIQSIAYYAASMFRKSAETVMSSKQPVIGCNTPLSQPQLPPSYHHRLPLSRELCRCILFVWTAIQTTIWTLAQDRATRCLDLTNPPPNG